MTLTSILRSLLTTLIFSLAGALSVADADPAAQTLDMAAFDQLKSLVGRWEGSMEPPASGAAHIEFEVTSNGRAVLERQFGGTPHEMITVYALAYDRLIANHFCAMGNQPAYRLSANSAPRDIRMEFVGGTGLDAATDRHANGERIEVLGPDELRVEYAFRTGKEPPTSAAMRLQRVKSQPSAEPAAQP